MRTSLPSISNFAVHAITNPLHARHIEERRDDPEERQAPRERPERGKSLQRFSIGELYMHRSVELVVGNFGSDALTFGGILKIDECTSSTPIEGHQCAHRSAAEATMAVKENRDSVIHGNETTND